MPALMGLEINSILKHVLTRDLYCLYYETHKFILFLD